MRPSGCRVLVTVTFNANHLQAHLAPMVAIPEIEEIILVSDTPAPSLPRLRTVTPPLWLRRIVGRAAAKLITCIWIARRERPDWVVGFNLVPHGLNAFVVARLIGARVLYHQIGGPREWQGGGWSSDNKVLGRMRRPSPALEGLFAFVLKRMDAIGTMGPKGRNALLDLGVSAERVRVIPASVVRTESSGTAERSPIYDVLSVGALLPVKGMCDLIEAAALLRDGGREVAVAIAGDGPLRTELEEQAVALGVATSVSFLGFRDDVHTLYGKARVFALPSRYEGLSIALIDAMAAGVPPVVADVGELSMVVEDRLTGYLYPSGDVRALADAIARLLDDEPLRERIGAAARQRALETARVDILANALRDLLLAGAPPNSQSAAPSGAVTSSTALGGSDR